MKVSKQHVELIDKMGTDLSVVNAARVSFDKTVSVIDAVKDRKLIKYLADHNHWSPFSHTSLSFRIKCPLFVARQLAKHQVGLSWNEVSRRYVNTEPEFYLPEYWRKKADNVKQGSSDEIIQRDSWAVRDCVQQSIRLYNEMIEKGCCSEQARMILPQNMMTEFIWTGSLYAFARVCNLRLDSHTQRETQDIAKLISNEVQMLFPISWEVLIQKGIGSDNA